MKKLTKLLTICIIAFSCLSVKAQTAKEILNSSTIPVTWLGIDFSAVKYTGEVPTTSGGGMMGMGQTGGPFVFKDQFNSMNEVIVGESEKKYNLKETFDKKDVPFNLKYMTEINSTIVNDNVKEFTSSSSANHFTAEDIKKMVSKYKFGSDVKGVGLLFIAERLSKTQEQGDMWVTFINIDTKEVILTEKVSGKPKGFGFRNYWLGAVAEMLKDIKSKNYKEWKKKYI